MGLVRKNKDISKLEKINYIQKNIIEFKGRKRFAEIIDTFNFVISAMSKNKSDVRIFKIHILIKDGEMIATDGARLHVSDLPISCDEGLYLVIKSTKSHVIIQKTDLDVNTEYPDYKSLLSSFEEGNNFKEVGDFDFGEGLSAWVLIAKAMPDSCGLNPDFFRPLYNWVYYFKVAGNGLVYFDGGTRKGFIMATDLTGEK